MAIIMLTLPRILVHFSCHRWERVRHQLL